MKELNWENSKWDDNSIWTFVLLKPGINEQGANKLFSNIIKSQSSDLKEEVFVHPLRKWRLYSQFENGKISRGQIKTVYSFACIAAVILLIASINYMNLCTARNTKRAKEVCVRKVIGAQRFSLITRYLIDSIILSFIAGIISLTIVFLSVNWFGKLTDRELAIPFSNPFYWVFFLAFIFVTGVLVVIPAKVRSHSGAIFRTHSG